MNYEGTWFYDTRMFLNFGIQLLSTCIRRNINSEKVHNTRKFATILFVLRIRAELSMKSVYIKSFIWRILSNAMSMKFGN